MRHVLFAMPGNEELTRSLSEMLGAAIGETVLRHFPDGETYVRVLTDVKDKEVLLVCTLHQPDSKLLPLYFLAQTLREMGATKIFLVAPYLAYMRQDMQFNPGEAVTSRYFARFIGSIADGLITIDPHLHRFRNIRELYTIPAHVLHAAPLLADWVKKHVQKPVLIGPDEESRQWVEEVASLAGAPFLVLQKARMGDDKVEVTPPAMDNFSAHTPVLVDDIVSTAHTMIETVQHLQQLTDKRPVCIGVHAVFAPGAYESLQQSGASSIVTCNTIPHPSNAISVAPLLVEAIRDLG